MCWTTSMSGNTCPNETGAYTRIFLAQSAGADPADFTITNTGPTAHVITAIDAAVEFIELFPDLDRDHTADSTQNVAGKSSFLHNITGFFPGDVTENEQFFIGGADCCGYICIVEHGTGNSFLYGANYNPKTGVLRNFSKLRPLLAATTDVQSDGENVGTTLTLSAPKVGSQRIPVAAAVIATLTIV